jgi:hypothetical protein
VLCLPFSHEDGSSILIRIIGKLLFILCTHSSVRCQVRTDLRNTSLHSLTFPYLKLNSSSQCKYRSWDSSVLGRGMDGWGSIPDKDKRFSLLQCPDRLWGPPTLLSSGYQGLFPRPGQEADYLSLFGAEVKNGGAIPPFPHTSSWRDAN